MVLGAYEEHVLGPRRRAKERADKAEKERDEARARADRALDEGRAWNRRRLKAQAHGEPFDEPYPDAEPES